MRVAERQHRLAEYLDLLLVVIHRLRPGLEPVHHHFDLGLRIERELPAHVDERQTRGLGTVHVGEGTLDDRPKAQLIPLGLKLRREPPGDVEERGSLLHHRRVEFGLLRAGPDKTVFPPILDRRHVDHLRHDPEFAIGPHGQFFVAVLVVEIDHPPDERGQYLLVGDFDCLGDSEEVDRLLHRDLGLVALGPWAPGLLRQHRRVDPERLEDDRRRRDDPRIGARGEVGELQELDAILRRIPDRREVEDEGRVPFARRAADDRHRAIVVDIGPLVGRIVRLILQRRQRLDLRLPLEDAGDLLDCGREERAAVVPVRVALEAKRLPVEAPP